MVTVPRSHASATPAASEANLLLAAATMHKLGRIAPKSGAADNSHIPPGAVMNPRLAPIEQTPPELIQDRAPGAGIRG